MMPRFANTGESEALELRSSRLAKNTRKVKKSAAETLRLYMREKGWSPNFENLTPEQLNDVLKVYYFDVTGDFTRRVQ